MKDIKKIRWSIFTVQVVIYIGLRNLLDLVGYQKDVLLLALLAFGYFILHIAEKKLADDDCE